MDNLSIDIVKNNKYYLKSPFKGQLISFSINDNDHITEGQVIGVLKTKNAYVEIESDYSGVVEKIEVEVNEQVEKWQDLMVIDLGNEETSQNIADSVDSNDFNVIYTFQHEAFPKFIYIDTAKLLTGIAHEEGEFIYYLLKKFYENYDIDIPFTKDQFTISEALNENKIALIGIDWPKLSNPLLTIRSYILIDTSKGAVGYFSCEKSLEGIPTLFFILPIEDKLTRFDYGPAPDDLSLEREKVVDSFIRYLNPKKKKSN